MNPTGLLNDSSAGACPLPWSVGERRCLPLQAHFFKPQAFFLILILPVVLGLAPFSAKAGALPLRKQLNQIERLLAQGQVEDAEQALAPHLRAAPGQLRLLQLRSEVLFLQGNYAAGLKIIREAVRKNRNAHRAKALRNLIAATATAVKGYVEHRSSEGHFHIWIAPGKDELLAPFAGETLEAIATKMQQSLGYMPQKPVRVEIYPSAEALAQVSPLTLDEINRSGTIALCKYNRLMLVTPRALLRGYSWRDTLAHEYVHLVVSRLSYNNMPVWLHEGLAKFFETAWRQPAETPPPLSPAQEHLLAESLRTRRFISWEDMHPSMAQLPNQLAIALAFAQVQTVIDFLVRQTGVAGLRRLIGAFRAGRSDWQALRMVTGLTYARFSQSWIKHLRTRNLRRLNGLVPPELLFRRQPTKEQRIAAVKQTRAQRFLRLAEMLRSSRMTQAAIIEYQKARLLLGQRDDLVANHLARAYLEISSPAQAISALLPVLEYYPEFSGPQVTMGIAYLESGNLRAAERHLKIALRINPFDPEIHCNLARVLRNQAREATLHGSLCQKLR